MEEENKKNKKKKEKRDKPNVWFSFRNSMHCKSQPSDVHNPKTRNQLSSILTKKTGRSGCSRSIANLKDVIHGGSKRHVEQPANCSPRSIGSSEFLNPITHEVILSNSKCELKITGFGAGFYDGDGDSASSAAAAGSTFVGTLRPGTPGPGGKLAAHYSNHSSFRNSAAPPAKNGHLFTERGELGNGISRSRKNASFDKHASFEKHAYGPNGVICHKCGEHFMKWEVLESHHLSKHAVTELVEGDSSRKIVEIICRPSLLKPETHCVRIERVLKVHNMQKTLARFEDYRETVKIKASRLPKKHPRCLADGNELLRFHGAILACSLGVNGSSTLCISDKCSVCRIIRNGFSTRSEIKGGGGVGVFTTSTSVRAFESIVIDANDNSTRKALIVCRVIAGRVHRPLENVEEIVGQVGFDSLAGKVGIYSNIEELYLLSPKALLPCFVVICKR